MSNLSELTALAFALWTDLQQGRVLWELVVVSASLLAAWLVGRQIVPGPVAPDARRAFGREALRHLQFPLTALAVVLIGCLIVQHWQNVHLLDLMVPLLTSLAIIRFAVLMLRQVFAPSGWLNALARVVGWAVWIGIGFGLQKIASNYVSGFIILMDRSVSIGDLVTVGEHTGQLTKMTARYVVLRSLGGVEAIIPNETIITSTVINHSYTDRRVRVLGPLQGSATR
jgi:small-conductance mechanosensitive channel